MFSSGIALTWGEAALLAVYYSLLVVLAVFGLHRLVLIRQLARSRGVVDPTPGEPAVWPSVTVQLPLYNEPNVAVRLVDAVTRFDYPGTLHIQVLDDSTDVTSALVAEVVGMARARGISIEQIRRDSRKGYKAGALAEGLHRTDTELVAIFDADFVPPPDLLLRMVPRFADPGVGMVQARWGHLNREHSLLTRAQAVYLDAHFAVESAARHRAGNFFNFNGTAGIWRRQAIEDAGGWSASTLTEDLDLSYRAQLAGWRFVFLPDLEVPAELPESLAAFHSQQRRWAKGSIQTARRILPSLWRAGLRAPVRLEAMFHLCNNSAYLFTLIVATLVVPAMAIRHLSGLDWTLAIDAVLFALSTGSVVAFYAEGQRRVGRRISRKELLAVLPVGIGMSAVNAAAVLEGLFETGGHFSRTPKTGSGRVAVAADRFKGFPVAESILGLFFLVAAVLFVSQGYYLAVPFVLLFLSGYAHVAVLRTAEIVRREAPGDASRRVSA